MNTRIVPNEPSKNESVKEKTCACCNEDCHDVLHNYGIIEVSLRNASVSEYMRHLEDRALKAEAKLANAQEPVAWMYSLVIEGEEVKADCSRANWNPKYQPFGRAGIDYAEGGIVIKTPLYTRPAASEVSAPKVDESANLHSNRVDETQNLHKDAAIRALKECGK